MSLTKRIAWNTLLQIIGRVLGTLLGLFSLAILTRYLGTGGYGAFTTVTGFLQFFGIVVDLGLTLTAVQMISEPGVDERKIMGTIVTIRLISGLIFFGCAPLIALLLPYTREEQIGIAIGSIAFFSMTQSQVLMGIFQKYLRMSRAVLAEVVGRGILLVGVWLVASNGWGLLGAVSALVLGNIVQLIMMISSSRALVPFRIELDRRLARTVFSRTWPIGLSIAFNLVYLKGDIVVLSLFPDRRDELGLYGAAYKVLDVVTVIPMMFMGLVLPFLVETWKQADHERFKKRLYRAFDFLVLLALPMVGGALVLASDVMELVSGVEFRSSGILLKILILAAGAVFFSGLYGHVIVAIGKQRQAIWGYAIDALLSLIGYAIFIPRFGAIAAAWVTVFAEVFIVLFTFALVSRVTRILPRIGTALKALIATGFMMLVLFILPPWPVVILIFIGATVYGMMLVILKAISARTIQDVVR